MIKNTKEKNESKKFINSLREINTGQLKGCSDCELLPFCSRCPGLADLEGKDILGTSPFDCTLAQCRKVAQNQQHWSFDTANQASVPS